MTGGAGPVTDLPTLPHYAVIFTSRRTDADDTGYMAAADRMMELAAAMPGFLGVDSARSDIGITVSYWSSLDAIAAWRDHPEHVAVRARGRAVWYDRFTVRIATVERAYEFERTG